MSPRLVPAGWSGGSGPVGDQVAFGASFASKGAPGTGVIVTVFGDALDRRLVDVESIEVSVDRSAVADRPREYANASSGRTLMVVEFPDLRFGHARSWPEPLLGAQVQVRVLARAVEIGEATVGVRVETMESAAGGAEALVSVKTLAAGRRPLRFDSSHRNEFHQRSALRNLGGTDTCLALLVVDEDDDVALPLAHELFARWFEACKEFSDGSGTVDCHLEYPGVSKMRFLPESAFPDRRGWKSVVAALPHLRSFDAKLRSPPPRPGRRPHLYGFSFLRDVDERWLADDDVVLPHILLWDQGRGRETRGLLAELVRTAAGRCELLQAVVTTTETPIDLGRRTPYEEVCGLRGCGLIGQAWTTRWLRWCAEQTWIGSPLVDRLGRRRKQLDPFIAGRYAGGLELKTDNVDALESALEPILPGADDLHD